MSAILAAVPTAYQTLQIKFYAAQPLYFAAPAMSRSDFYDFCIANQPLRIERNADQQIIIMPPAGGETGNRNSEINAELGIWNRQQKLGLVFDSSTAFTLPNGAERAPDTAWVRRERWEALPAEEKKKFAAIAPDFVMELRSEGQGLAELRQKMEEYMEAGCRLAWLIDPQHRRTFVYTGDAAIQTIGFDEMLSGGEVMPGLSICLAEVLQL
jgi:Uma2 family endonuclease